MLSQSLKRKLRTADTIITILVVVFGSIYISWRWRSIPYNYSSIRESVEDLHDFGILRRAARGDGLTLGAHCLLDGFRICEPEYEYMLCVEHEGTAQLLEHVRVDSEGRVQRLNDTALTISLEQAQSMALRILSECTANECPARLDEVRAGRVCYRGE